MADAKQAARDDLAFMKALVEGRGGLPKNFGLVYFLAGAIYGVQVLLQGLAAVGWIALAPIGHLIVGVAPTIVFLVVLSISLWRDRKQPITGATQRGLNGAFGATGLANGALAVMFGIIAIRQESFLLWLMFPIVAFTLQGAAWFLAYMLQRKRWVLGIAIGWLATALVMTLTIETTPLYIVAVGFGLIAFMALPGFLLMRRRRAAG